MKKILIIEDDQIVANVYRNKLAVEGYQAEIASDGETGINLLKLFKPDLVVLDLMLPRMSGVDVIKAIRGQDEFANVPIIVFSNTYLTNLVQEAWKAGATKCISKASCSPREVIDIVRGTIGESGAFPQGMPVITNPKKPKPASLGSEADSEFQADLRKTFIDSLPATLTTLRATLQSVVKADSDITRLKQIYELYRAIHALNGNAGVAGLVQIAHFSGAVEALLKELYEKPKNINHSTLRTVANSVDFLGLLFTKGTLPDQQEIPSANILVVDDEPISRRAITYALEKARLKAVNVEKPEDAYKLLAENVFDLVFLDVDMPGMTGFELCTKLRALPLHKKTPVVFVTSLSDFDNRTSSTMAGGNDFIAKPFLFIELTVKALIHVLRGKLMPAK